MAEPIAFDVEAARADGVSDAEIAAFLAPKAGFDLAAARKDGIRDSDIVAFLAPAPKAKAPEPEAGPASGTLKGMGKAAAQTLAAVPGGLINAYGAMVTGGAVATKSYLERPRAELQEQVKIMEMVDAGTPISARRRPDDENTAVLAGSALRFSRDYAAMAPDRRAEMRAEFEGKLRDMPAFGDTPEGKIVAGIGRDVGPAISKVGKEETEWAKKTFPLTEEEEKRGTVITTKIIAGLVPYVASAVVGGLPGIIGYSGVDAYGHTWDEAKKAGASDEDAAGAALIGGVVQGGLNAVPPAQAMHLMKALPGRFAKGEFIKILAGVTASSGTLLTFSQISQLADNVIAKDTFDPKRDLTKGMGENLVETAVAGAILPLGGAAVGRVLQRNRAPEVVADKVMEAPSVDAAIEAAREEVRATPVDVEAFATEAREFGGRGDQQQAAVLQLFDRLGRGVVERTGDGAYHYRTDEGAIPLKVWDGQDGIPPALAQAQREHYGRMGIEVVHFQNDARIPFDGAVDPKQPNTIFLSSDPQRNAAQVASHEVAHVLETTKLPDGTNLGDLLHKQVLDGVTSEGWRYANEVFGKTAPDRADFPNTPEGAAAHADAVVAHLVRELGADIGAEAPRFQDFTSRVVDTVQQRYGIDAAKDVIVKLMDGIRKAMETLRQFFLKPEDMAEYGQPETKSQAWVTNLNEVHGTLAKMYAERFGTQAERERASLVAMRNRATRARAAAEKEAAAAPAAEVPPVPAEATPVPAPVGRIADDANRIEPIRSTTQEIQASVDAPAPNRIEAIRPAAPVEAVPAPAPTGPRVIVNRVSRAQMEADAATPPDVNPPLKEGPKGIDIEGRAAPADHRFADQLADMIERGGDLRGTTGQLKLAGKDVQALADRAYGGTLATGAYSRDRVYDAMELGVNRFIQNHPERFSPAVDVAQAKEVAADLARLKDSLPTQTVRAGEKDTYQQFSTPPDYAYAANWVANLRSGDHVLEPSAGVGGLLVHAMNARVRETTANELSDKRRGMIEALKPSRVTGEDAAQLHNILPSEVRPTVVVMNPPFSRAAERMGGKMVLDEGAKHIEQALARLEPGGRLVAIVGDGMKPEGTEPVGTGRGGTGRAFRDWWARIGAEYDVRANIGVDRGIYSKYGTSFPTRLLVIDKNPPSGRELVTGQVRDAAGIIDRLQEVRNDRGTLEQVAGQPGRAEVAQGSESLAGRERELRGPTGELGAGERPSRDPAADVAEPAGAPRRGGDGERAPGVGPAGIRAGEPLVRVEPEPAARGAGEEPRPAAGARDEPAGSGADRGRDGVQPDGSGERVEPGVTPASEIVLATENALARPDPAPEAGVSEAIYETYRPQRVQIAGAKAHPGALVQSAAMASVLPPKASYKPRLPPSLIKDGALSDAQLEAIVYAGQAHSDVMPNGKRRGFFIGDGTGVGKGREIAGILLDNKQNGRTKAVWVSEKRALLNDAKRDWNGLHQPISDIIDHGKTKAGDDIAATKGILFTTYDTLKSAEQTKADGEKVRGRERVDQIVEWLGKDFDGVIAFDESHNLGNAVDTKGGRGVKKAAQKALAGVALQEKLPNARVVYVSATGATEVGNLAYADRLGLWGEGTGFANREDFVGKVSSGGMAAMELVARDMKALGHYIARSLSYDGVSYDRVEHVLSKDQRVTYDKLAEGWQTVLQNFGAAMEATGITKDGKTLDSKAKSAMLSAFWGGHQRFFNQIITSMQMPSVIRGVEKDLKEGRQAVLQLVNTMEAAQERALEKARKEGEGMIEDLDMTPRDQLMQLIQKSFPVQQRERYIDENGNERSRGVVDSKGNPVINKQAEAARERLLDELGSIRVPDGPLEMLINHFGADKVAEVTGRGQRVVRKADDSGRLTTQVEKRGAQANVADANDFQEGKKPILIFSEAGGTGRSYHAAIGSGSENARRSHYLVQGGWRADKAVQGFGRTHRTSQASAPIFHLVTTDLQGQKRFISSIARRLGQLGALTKGERRTGDQGLFGARDNLESTEARDGLTQFFRDVSRGEVEGVTMNDLEKGMGLKLRDPDTGGLASELPAMSQFLNRVLSLTIERQNKVFEAFSERMDQAIDRAAAAGTLDTGVETYRADRITKQSEQTVYTDPRSGAETKHLHLLAQTRNRPVDFDTTLAGKNKTNGKKPEAFVQNVRSGKVFAVTSAGDRTDSNGSITSQYRLTSPIDYQLVDRDKIGRDNWKKLTEDEARPLWDEQVAKTPEYRNSDLHLITGAVLPIWDRIGGNPKIYRLQTAEGERMLGRVIPASLVDATLERLGAEGIKVDASPGEIATRVLDGATARLANEWTIKRSRVSGEQRLELVGPDYRHGEELKRHGVFNERIAYVTRFFIPTEPAAAAAAIEAITKTRPVTSLADAADPVRFSPKPQEAFYSALTRGVEGLKIDRAPPGQWEATIRNMPGIKAEERAWTGVEEWLRSQPKPVTKAEVLDYLRAHEVQVREVKKGGNVPADAVAALRRWVESERGLDNFSDADWSAVARGDANHIEALEGWGAPADLLKPIYDNIGQGATKFGTYVLPGGENYRELLLTLPANERVQWGEKQPPGADYGNTEYVANYNGRERVEGVADYPFTVGNQKGRITYWPETFGHRGNPEGPRWIVNSINVQNAHFKSEAEARAFVEKSAQEDRFAMQSERFKSGHWDESNVLAHVRFDDRTGPNGEKVLHVAEIQSDWHQKGRKEGYNPVNEKPVFHVINTRTGQKYIAYDTRAEAERDIAAYDELTRQHLGIEEGKRALTSPQGVPDAPFKTTWPELAMKRMIRYAAEHGYDRLSWDTGTTNAERYDLSKKVGELIYTGDNRLIATGLKRETLISEVVEPEKLPDFIGKEAAEKLLAQKPSRGPGDIDDSTRHLRGPDLKIGGEGMLAFYDKQLPIVAGKIAKKFGAKVEASTIDTADQRALADAQRSGDSAAIGDAFAKVSVHSLDINDAMRDSVMQGQPLFSPRTTGENPTREYTPEEREAFARLGRVTEPTTLRDKIDNARDDIGRKLIRETLDAYIGIKGNDPEGYMAARLANSVAGAQEVFRLYGTLKFDGATYNYRDLNGGVRGLVKALGPEAHDFLWWVAAHRAERLKAEDRENLFSDDDIAAMKDLNRGEVAEPYTLSNGKTTLSREAMYADALARYDVLNKSVTDLVAQSGLVKRDVVDALWADPFYVPFFREAAEEGSTRFVGNRQGFVKQYASRRLEGGADKLRTDLWENAFGNWDHMIDAALRNRASVQILDKAADLGAARKISERDLLHMSKAERGEATWVMVDGERQNYQVTDPMVFKAVSALESVSRPGPIMAVARWFSRALRYGVTANPWFAVRTLIRDTGNSIAVSEISRNPLKNLADGFSRLDAPDRLKNLARVVAGRDAEAPNLAPETISAMAGGALMRLGAGSGAETGVAKTDLRNVLDTPGKLKAFGRYIADVAGAYKETLSSAEDVNRMALYSQLRKAGADHDFASFSARDLQDFTLRGAAPFVRSLVEITPFLNARFQGLYKIGRSAADADKSIAAAVGTRVARNLTVRTAAVLGAMTVAGIALDAIYRDDEEYKKRTEHDRQTYYWFRIGDAQFRIPKGFELAALSSLATDGIEAFFSKEMTGERLVNNFWTSLRTNLQVQAPAVAQPLIDLHANTRATGGPIENRGMERLQPEQRYTQDNTLIARGISSAVNSGLRAVAPRADGPSPVQIDYLASAYGAWLATNVLGMADTVVRSFSSEPAKPAKDFWAQATQGLVSTEPRAQSRYVDMLYEQGIKVEQAYATYRDLLMRGQAEEARRFLEANKEQIQKHGLVSAVMRAEGDLNRQIRFISNNPDPKMTPEKKRIQIMELQSMKNKLAQQAAARMQ